METVLEIANLVKTYGFRGNLYPALNGVNLDVKPGEFMGVMGPSGSGKTTLLNLVATIDRPSRGEIRISGKEIQKMRSGDLAHFRREELGFIFQNYNLLDTLTVRENIALPLSIANRPPAEILARVKQIAETFHLSDLLDKFPDQVSGGQKQRAAAARAVIANPALVLADEPTGALDSHSARILLETLERMNTEMHVTILMVTHDATAASYCSRIVFLKDGRIVHELKRGAQPRRAFFDQILEVVAMLGDGEAA
jgi:putative ABC transport system ATP-binding protein